MLTSAIVSEHHVMLICTPLNSDDGETSTQRLIVRRYDSGHVDVLDATDTEPAPTALPAHVIPSVLAHLVPAAEAPR